MSSNSAFLQPEWPELFEEAGRAESFALPDPRACCFYARRALELLVLWMYRHDSYLQRPYDATLNNLLGTQEFQDNMPHAVYIKTRLIQKTGNRAVHELPAGHARRIPQSCVKSCSTSVTGLPKAIRPASRPRRILRLITPCSPTRPLLARNPPGNCKPWKLSYANGMRNCAASRSSSPRTTLKSNACERRSRQPKPAIRRCLTLTITPKPTPAAI